MEVDKDNKLELLKEIIRENFTPQQYKIFKVFLRGPKHIKQIEERTGFTYPQIRLNLTTLRLHHIVRPIEQHYLILDDPVPQTTEFQVDGQQNPENTQNKQTVPQIELLEQKFEMVPTNILLREKFAQCSQYVEKRFSNIGRMIFDELLRGGQGKIQELVHDVVEKIISEEDDDDEIDLMDTRGDDQEMKKTQELEKRILDIFKSMSSSKIVVSAKTGARVDLTKNEDASEEFETVVWMANYPLFEKIFYNKTVRGYCKKNMHYYQALIVKTLIKFLFAQEIEEPNPNDIFVDPLNFSKIFSYLQKEYNFSEVGTFVGYVRRLMSIGVVSIKKNEMMKDVQQKIDENTIKASDFELELEVIGDLMKMEVINDVIFQRHGRLAVAINDFLMSVEHTKNDNDWVPENYIVSELLENKEDVLKKLNAMLGEGIVERKVVEFTPSGKKLVFWRYTDVEEEKSETNNRKFKSFGARILDGLYLTALNLKRLKNGVIEKFKETKEIQIDEESAAFQKRRRLYEIEKNAINRSLIDTFQKIQIFEKQN